MKILMYGRFDSMARYAFEGRVIEKNDGVWMEWWRGEDLIHSSSSLDTGYSFAMKLVNSAPWYGLRAEIVHEQI